MTNVAGHIHRQHTEIDVMITVKTLVQQATLHFSFPHSQNSLIKSNFHFPAMELNQGFAESRHPLVSMLLD